MIGCDRSCCVLIHHSHWVETALNGCFVPRFSIRCETFGRFLSVFVDLEISFGLNATVLLLAGPIAEYGQNTVDVVSDLVRYYGEPFGGLPTNLVLIVLEPFLDVNEVGVQRSFVSRMNHPYYEDELDEAIDYAPTRVKQD